MFQSLMPKKNVKENCPPKPIPKSTVFQKAVAKITPTHQPKKQNTHKKIKKALREKKRGKEVSKVEMITSATFVS